MLRMAKTRETLDDDPRPKDAVLFNRLKLLVEHEAIDRAWGCPLYILNRTGWLTNEQREAGDKYQQITLDYGRTQDLDPEEMIPEARDLMYRRIERHKKKWKQAVGVLMGFRSVVDRLVLSEEYLTTEHEKITVRWGLQLLSDFFCKGTKRQHKICP